MQSRYFENEYFNKGFTLVELLIVIVVIGVLAAAFIYSSTEAVITAKVTKIILDLKTITKAANSWYLDHYKQLKIFAHGEGFVLDDGTPKGIKLHDYFKAEDSGIIQYFDRTDINFNKGLSNYKDKNSEQYYAPVGGYSIYIGFGNTVCYAVYGISEHNKSSEEKRIKEKLKARAKSAGLVSYRFREGHTSSASEYNGIDANVFMEAFRFSDTDPAAKN